MWDRDVGRHEGKDSCLDFPDRLPTMVVLDTPTKPLWISSTFGGGISIANDYRQ